jgi:hypothetical protein
MLRWIFSAEGLAIILAGAAIVVGVALYFRALRDRRPMWAMSTRPVFDLETTDVPGLAVTYAGEHISRLTTTLITFWNAGRGPISRDDISGSSPLRIEAAEESTQLIDAEIIAVTSDGCGFSLDRGGDSRSSRLITFEYMNHRDGFTVKLLHTGKVAARGVWRFSGLRLAGGIRGVRSLRYAQRTWWPVWALVYLTWVAGWLIGFSHWLPAWARYLGAASYLPILGMLFWGDRSNAPPRQIGFIKYPDVPAGMPPTLGPMLRRFLLRR